MKSKSAIVVFLFVLLCQSAFAQATDSGKWWFRLAPYLWTVNIKGDNTVGPVTVPLDVKFGDIFSTMKFAGSLHFEAGKDRWVGVFDIAYIKIGEDVEIPDPISMVLQKANYDFTIFTWELLGTYRFTKSRSKSLEGLAGIRFTQQKMELTITAPMQDRIGGFTETWVDPVIGIRYISDISPKWYYTLRGDIGGFGIGADFTWNIAGNIIWRVSRVVDVSLGAKYLDVDYKNDKTGTAEFFAFDGYQAGILLGAIFNF
jgi:hypothetical protein